MEKKLEALAQNKEFLEKFSATKTPEEAVELLAAEGVVITVDELQTCFTFTDSEEELKEDALDEVAGGRIIRLPFPFPLPIPRPRPWPRFPKK